MSAVGTVIFEPFRLDLRSGRLLRGREPVPLRPKTWAVLRYLVERPGVLVTKDELLNAVWADVAVTESVLSKSIGELRVALGDSFKASRFIETVQRRGLRFIAETNVAGRESLVSGFREGQPQTRDWELETGDQQPETRVFVGRTRELQRLAGLLAKARAGERQIVFVTGSAGIGKTALIEAFLDSPAVRHSAAPIWIGRGVCVEQHGPREAYMPVLEALDRLARRPDAERVAALLRRLAPTWWAQMPWLIGDDERPALQESLQAVRSERMLREFAALIEALTADVTLVLVLEDLHWCDPSTVDLLSVLGERDEAARLLVIGTYRPADAVVREHALMNAVRTLHVRRRCAELALSDLTVEGVQSYLHTRFPGSKFPPALARPIYSHTDGNPLFMVGVVDHLLSRGLILDTAPGWALRMPPDKLELGVPADVRLLIEHQLHGLSPADRALLQAASVAGNDFTALVVAAALGVDVADVEMRCEAFAHAQRLLRIAGHIEWPDRSVARRYAFTHDLYRQVVYGAIPDGHCMRLHQRIGQALEAAYGARQVDIAAQLALHFERGRDDARALRYLELAAAHARQRFASREAIGYLDAALALVARLPDEDERHRRELDLRLALGAALSDLFGFGAERVRENYERAAALCAAVGSTEQLFRITYARWYLHAIRAERKEAITLAAELSDLARRLRTVEHRMLADSVMIRTALYDGRFADVNRLAQRHLLRRRPRKSAATTVAYGPDPAIVAATHFAVALWALGYPERARKIADAAVARARESGHFFTLSAVLMQATLVDLLCGNTAAGGVRAEQAMSVSAEHGFAFWNALACVLRGWALVRQGRAFEGAKDIEHALSALQATGTRFFSAYAYAFLAEGRLRAGALADGLAAVDAGLAVARATLDRAYEPELWRLKGELLLRVASRQSRTERSRSGGRRLSTHNRDDGERCFQRALALARAAKAKSLELRAATSMARAWQARGRTADARKLLGGVCKWFGARSPSADLTEARALLGELTSTR